ncbi:maltodextrin transport system permease protein MalD [Maritalea myrionectae]|uniref:sn-glycerol-3-phosphate transport system permease protein UgpE n=1 Tax=Maritalea myrionectae TaxID=454601 RepID=A0A2R4MGA9_9HYPH|nr:carbohydrate ABC transporter permease [Maritalea myrionectae]AVX04926.1 maltodextrin transport system permease protein MalD [Maritalea myrionectae]
MTFRWIRRRQTHALQPTTGAIVASYVTLIVACIVSIVPFLYVLSTSVKRTKSLFSYPPDWLPDTLYWGNYEKLLTEHPFILWTINTLIVALAVTLIKLLIDAMAAYALAKLHFTGRNVLSATLLMAVAIPVAALIIPLYFLVRDLGLLNTYWALILPPLANPLGIFMIRSFIVSLPDDLGHSARLDGETEFGIFFRIILPLIKPGLVVHAIFTFMLQYTNFLWPLVAIQDERKQVLTVGISGLQSNFVVDWGLISAAALLAAVPITLLFVLLQRFFLAQNLAGAFKG